MLTWHHPASSTDVEAILADTRAGRLVPPRERAPKRRIPAALEAVVFKAMEVEPDKRYQTVASLARDVRAFAAGYATSLQSAGVLHLLWLLIRRHRGVSTLSAVGLALVAALGAAAVSRIRASEKVAVDALLLFKSEQRVKQEVGRLAAPRLLKDALRQLGNLEFEKSRQTLDLALTLDDSLSAAWSARAALHVGAFEFDAAVKAFEAASPRRVRPKAGGKNKPKKRGPPAEREADLAGTCSLLAKAGVTFPDRAQFLHLVKLVWMSRGERAVRQKDETVALLCGTYLSRPLPRDARVDVVKEALRIVNPQVADLQCDYVAGPGGEELTLRGNRDLSCLAPLYGLPLAALDVADTSVADLGVLAGMPLRRLILAGSPVRSLAPVLQAPLDLLDVRGCPHLPAHELKPFRGIGELLADSAPPGDANQRPRKKSREVSPEPG
jgi:hypothetical protein